MNTAFKYRIYPNEEQKIIFAQTFGCVRLVYNYFLGRKINQYKEDGSNLSYYQCAKKLTQLKKNDDFSFLKDVDSIALQQSLKRLDTAYTNFFEKRASFPKFKSKKNNRNSYTTNCVNNNIKLKDGYIILPKVGAVKLKKHRSIPENYVLKSVTVTMTTSNKYYVSVLFSYENQVEEITPKRYLGLDFSMHELFIDSNGFAADYPRFFRRAQSKLAKEQRKLSKMQKGSKNREKQRIKVAKIHEKISNQRYDFLHKLSYKLATEYDCICVEDLNMKAIAQCLNFGKSVNDNGWGTFINLLKYKLEARGKSLVKVDKWFASSQTCSVCGYKNPVTKDLKIRVWTCPECFSYHDRDINAAINIRNEGIRMFSNVPVYA